MPAILDDIDARPGSTTSLLRTFVGLYLRRLGGWIAVADLVTLMGGLGVSEPATRNGIVRLKHKRLLLSERRASAGYRLNPNALPMLERGDSRIFHVRQMAAGEKWCLISYSLDEGRRDVRHQLRRRLQWIGCGTVAPGLWICPWYLCDEVEEILVDLGVQATMFLADTPKTSGSLVGAVASWWNLEVLRAAHVQFQMKAMHPHGNDPTSHVEETQPAEAFRRYVHLIDSWRLLPYIDPGLPAAFLPEDWPGQESTNMFSEQSRRYETLAWAHVGELVEANNK